MNAQARITRMIFNRLVLPEKFGRFDQGLSALSGSKRCSCPRRRVANPTIGSASCRAVPTGTRGWTGAGRISGGGRMDLIIQAKKPFLRVADATR
jgi:hypothetical protein